MFKFIYLFALISYSSVSYSDDIDVAKKLCIQYTRVSLACLQRGFLADSYDEQGIPCGNQKMLGHKELQKTFWDIAPIRNIYIRDVQVSSFNKTLNNQSSECSVTYVGPTKSTCTLNFRIETGDRFKFTKHYLNCFK